MSDVPTPQQILDAVRAAGWLLEQDSARAMEMRGLHTQLGWAYPDPEDPTTSREIDVHGYRQFYTSEDARLTVSARVLVECKQSSNPYVLIGRHLHPRLHNEQPTEHILPYRRLVSAEVRVSPNQNRTESMPAWTGLRLHEIPSSPSLNTFRATQMTRLDRGKTWTADNHGVFTSLVYPLAKALRHAQRGLKTSDWPTVTAPKDEWFTVGLHFPVVVTSAPIYVIDATTDDASPLLSRWTTMRRQLTSDKVSGVFDIDVVTYSALDTYLEERVVRFAEAVARLAEENPRRFTSQRAT